MWFIDVVYKVQQMRLGTLTKASAYEIWGSVHNWIPAPSSINVFEGGDADEFGSGKPMALWPAP